MAGVYLHIPFCKSRCRYCDFFSTTFLEKREAYVHTMLREWQIRKSECPSPIHSLYFGGGTPSLLSAKQIETLIAAIATSDTSEITLEANPGDLTPCFLHSIRQAGVNRLSIGIQSFHDSLLHAIGRRHTAAEAILATKNAQAAGFSNLSIDLMYGLPGQTMEQWTTDIATTLSLPVKHISSYCLSYEQGTPLWQMLEQGLIQETDEDTANQMYDYLCEQTAKAGFFHYEVSNFAIPGFQSEHNSSYWNGTPYIGLGPGAHSFDGNCRSWNIANLETYIAHADDGKWLTGEEQLGPTEKYNEYILLGLRTVEGISFQRLQQPTIAQRYIERGLLQLHGDQLSATQSGLHILNRIIEDLMI